MKQRVKRPLFRVEHELFPTRLRILRIVTIVALLFVSSELYVQSVVAHDETALRAKGQYLIRKAIEPERGLIFARDFSMGDGGETFGLRPLATNRLTYSLSVVPKNLDDRHEAAQLLAPWAELSEEELFQSINNDRLYLPPLRHGLSEAEKDELTALDLPGMLLTEEQVRYYPEQTLASQILGFVNAEGVGNYGVEQAYDEELKGSGGEVVAERDVKGRILAPQDQLPVVDGASLVLTIERNVQGFVEQTLAGAIQEFEADSGSIIIMDIETGELVALANLPDFNPNTFRDTADDPWKFLNPTLNAVWEPGSIFKTIVMAAALDENVVEPTTEGVFSNVVAVSGYQIHTAEDKAFGRETMTQVLENSDNVAMVWLADLLGTERLYIKLAGFGFGTPTGVDLPGEESGTLLDQADWRDIHRATIAFGQGVAVTPLQLVTALSVLANGGHLVQPHIVDYLANDAGTMVTDIEPPVVKDQIIRPETSAEITDMMVSVVENGHGKRARVPGYKIAGKTGTAQIPNPQGGYFEDRHIGGFGGFFPADRPRFAMVVKLDNPKTVRFAESSAAPTFGKIAQFMLNYYRIPPTVPIEANP